LLQTLVPAPALERDYLIGVVAVFGTTIAPYLMFWQASEEVDEVSLHPASRALILAPDEAPKEIRRIRLDTYFGIGFSNLVGLCIIVTTALTLHASGTTNIETAAQAAEALRPIAGPFAFVAFAAGIIGTGLLAVPVLAGSSAYAIAESFNSPVGFGRKPQEALMFYGIIAASTLIGVVIHFSPIDPIKALFWSAVVNGVLSVPIMAVTMIVAVQPRIMGQFVLPAYLRWGGWISTAIIASIVVGMLATILT
jgi:Mn2+/Fe2+ NRAMP family transporter